MAKRRNQKSPSKQPKSKSPEKSILASGSFSHTPEVNVLEQDLYREYKRDKGDTDTGLLVNDKWLRFFDVHSNFLKRMVALVANSPTLRNITNQKTSLTMGAGFIPVSSKEVPYLQILMKFLKLKTSDDKAIEGINTLIGNVNFNNETLEEVIEKVSFDWYAFGNAIVELKKSKRDSKEVVMIYHIPLEQVGIKKANQNGIIESIGVTANWDNDGTDPTAITEIPLYPKFNSQGSSAIHIKNYAPNFFYWGLPNWISAQFWAETEYKIPKYNNSKLDNGYKPSALIQAYGSFTDEEAEALVESFLEGYTGTGNNAGLQVQILRKKEDAADITLYEDKSEGSWIELQKLSSQAIVTASGWTPSLSGIAQAGQLGSNQQIRDELEFVTNMEIKRVMRKITQSIINPFVLENQKLNPSIAGIMLRIANMNPISLASLLDPKQDLTKNERREILGYEALEEDELEEGEQANKEDLKPQTNE